MRIHSTRSILLVFSDNAPNFGRRGTVHAEYIHLHQATRQFQLSRAPRTCFTLDQTANDLFCAWNTRRSDQRQSRITGRKRSVTTPTDHLTSTNKTARLPAEGSASPGAFGQNGSNLETGHLSRPASDTSAASIMNSSVCSGSANQRRTRESQGSRPRRSA
jgi:hypothetical protein